MYLRVLYRYTMFSCKHKEFGTLLPDGHEMLYLNVIRAPLREAYTSIGSILAQRLLNHFA